MRDAEPLEADEFKKLEKLVGADRERQGARSKHLYPLVVSVPFKLSGPRSESLIERAACFDKHGYARVWVVDAAGCVLELGPRRDG